MTEPRIDSNRPIVGPAKPTAETEEQKAMAAAISAKIAAGGTSASRAAGSAVSSLDGQDTLQVSADVMRMAGESLKKRPGAGPLSGAGSLITSVNKAKQGDSYSAAVHASMAMEKLTPALAKSKWGAAANAIVLAVSPRRLKDAHAEIKQTADQALDESASKEQRTKAWLDLSSATWQVAYIYRVVSRSAVKAVTLGVAQLGRIARLAPGVFKAQAAFAKIAASPVGKAFKAFEKWVPFLNVAGVAVSAKNAIDVVKDDRSSKTSTVLAVGSVALAGVSLYAAIGLGIWPFLGITALSIGADVALLIARKRDHSHRDTDQALKAQIENPGEAIADGARLVSGLATEAADYVEGKLKAGLRPEKDAK